MTGVKFGTRWRQKARSLRRLGTLLPIVGAVALLAGSLTTVAVSAAPGDAPVTGSLFVDFARNGALDAGDSIPDTDPLFPPAGIQVTAFDPAGGSVAATITPGTPPTYSIDPTTLVGSDYRLEFTLDPADEAAGWSATVRGADSASAVQFVSAGDIANFGVVPPTNCRDGDGSIFFTCHTVDVLTETVVTSDFDTANMTQNAAEGDTGSVWGITYDEWTNTIWTSSMLRRGFPQGAQGLGGLYAQTDGGAWRSFDLGPSFAGGFDPSTASDAETAAQIGRIGIGDIDLHDDGRTLFVSNVATNTVHVYDVTSGTPVETTTIPVPNPGCAAGDSYYIWALNATSATTALVGATCTADVTNNGANLSAHVLEVSTAPGVTPVPGLTNLALDYPRGCGLVNLNAATPCTPNSQPWTDSSEFLLSQTITQFNADWNDVMQPLLSNIEVGPTGEIVLTFLDRTGYQHSAGSIWDDPATPGVDESASAMATATGGDIIHVANAGTVDNPVYVVEPGVALRDGSEFYNWDFQGGFHAETASGSAWVHPNRNELIATTIDPLRFDSYGFEVANVSTGASVAGYELGNNRQARSFKSGVLGDIEGCFAPVEIGDRVWLDVNGDGIQDPGEASLEGVTVTITGPGLPAGGVVRTTDADGVWTVDSSDGLIANENYTVTVNVLTNTTALPPGVTNADLTESPADSTGTNANDLNDSDLVGGTMTVTAGPIGTNDHSFDAGFVPPANNRIGNLIWLDIDNNAAVDADEPGIEGLTVELYIESGNAPGFDAADTLVDTTTTDATGNYWFENLLDGETYYVAVPEDQAGNTVLVNGQELSPDTITSSTGGDLANNDTDNIDDGDPAPGFASVSGPIDLADGAEVTGETDTNTTTDAEAYVEANGGTDYADSDSNLTVDLGFTQASRIGNKVWLDGIEGDAGYNDGIADGTEDANGIGNVTVELYEDAPAAGTPGVYDPGIDLLVDSTFTDADGSYWFDNVTDGTYFVAIPTGQTLQTVDGAAVDLDDLVSSTPPASDANAGIDDVDDGAPAPGFAAITGPIDIVAGASPEDEAGDFAEGTAGGQEADINTKGSFFSDANSDLTIDFGFVEGPKYAIGNLVWVDTNDDGIAQTGEPGIEGVRVELYDAADNLVAFTTTDVNGAYVFDDLVAGEYRVSIPGNQTGQFVGGDPADLQDLLPSSVAVPDPDAPADVDNDSNGVEAAGAITSGLLAVGDPDMLTPTEPTNETVRADDPTDDDPGGAILTDEQRNFTVDFGFVQPLRVGNLVWLDDGGEAGGLYTSTDEDDGQADVGEVGVQGVLVQLLDDVGAVVAETVTTADGNYWFDGLRAGDYQVGIPLSQVPALADPQPDIIAGALDGLASSTGQSATGETADDDDDGEPSGVFASLSAPFNLAYGDEATDENGDFADPGVGGAENAANTGTGATALDENSNLEIDFGFAPTPTYRIGNLVWEEIDGDGIADPGEPGVPGLLVQLLDGAGTLVAETITDADGHYLFDELLAGDYQVRIPTDQTATLGGADGTPDLFDNYQTSGTPEPNADGNVDNDNNGVPGADGLTSGIVTLGGDPEPTNETTRLGDPTLDEEGALPDDRSNLTVDFGLEPLYRLGNLVWEDYNNDGIAQDGEPAIEGVLVQLLDATGAVIAETVTDVDGKYEFASLVAGDYRVRIPGDQTPTLGPLTVIPGALDGLSTSGTPEADANNGSDNDNNGVVDGADFTSGVVSLGDGDGASEPLGETLRDDDAAADEVGPFPDNRSDLSVDFGFFRGLRLGNQIFLDGLQGEAGYNNGIFDPGEVGEVGISGVTVELWLDENNDGVFDPNVDTQLTTTTTDSEGNYYFDDLDPDTPYFVAVEDIGSGSATTEPVTGDPADDDNDNDGAPTMGYDSVTDVIVLSDPATAPTSTGELDTIPAGDEPAEDEANAVGDLYPDTNSELQIDLGFIEVPLYRIGNLVWEDLDNDGIAEVGEDGIADVTVELLDEAGVVVATTITDADGNYEFPLLIAGTYTVSIPMDQPALADKDSSNNGEDADQNGLTGADNNDNGTIETADAWTSEPIVIGAEDPPFGTEPTDETLRADDTATDDDPDGGFYTDDRSNYTVDFGFLDIPKYTVGNLIWIDENDNGIADADEPGLGNVAITLLDAAGQVVAQTTTAADGTYLFEDLEAGEYQIVLPAGQTGQPVDDGSGRTVDLQELLGSSNEQADPQDDADNDTNGLAQPDGTVSTGLLSVGLPDRLNPDEPVNEANRDGGDDDDGGTTTDEQRNLTLDIGFVEPLRVGNTVWLDDGGASTDAYDPTTEDDGIADPTEVGIAGVLVQLLDDTGAVIAETVTNAVGNYWFDDLRAGDYQVGIPDDQTPELGPQPAIVAGALDEVRSSTGISADGEASDDDDDGNPDTAGGWASLSAPFNLDHNAEADDEAGDLGTGTGTEAEDVANTAGTTLVDTDSNLEIDFGFSPTPTYRLGNLVWEDYDNDGLAEDGEPGIAGVLVQLLDDTGTVIAETVTDADGHYEFTGLEAGDYQVNLPGDQTPVLADPQPDIVEGALDGLTTSGTPNGADDETDNDNNGVADGADFTSGVIELGEGTGNEEPIDEELRDGDGTLDEDATLRDDRSELTVDFGLFRGLRLGNQVFRDGEQGDPGYNNGVFDTDEIGIAGVEVEIWEDDGDGVFDPATDTLIDTTTTDTEGNYSFGNLDPDTPYIVAINDIGVGSASEVVSADALDGDNDNDGAPAGGYDSVSQPVVLTVGGATLNETDTIPAGDEPADEEADAVGDDYPDENSEMQVDFGFIDLPLYRIGNLVWDDIDNDGLAEVGEDGIAGVTVQLLDATGAVIAETVTDADGKYEFANLMAGDYQVSIPRDQEALDGFSSSNQGEEADVNADGDNNDNGIDGADAWTSSVIGVGPNPLEIPFGSEPGDETLRADDPTDDDDDAGFYTDDRSNYSVDFGFYKLVLGNQIWIDTNADGILDADETPVDGVPVILYKVEDDGSLTQVAETVTSTIEGQPGSYFFDGLESGATYVVELPDEAFVEGGPLEGLYSSPDPASGARDADDDPTDGDDNGADGDPGDAIRSLPITMVVGEEPTGEPSLNTGAEDTNENLGIDFGVTALSLGGTLWEDTNNNGVPETPEEEPLVGVPVELWAADPVTGEVIGDAPIATTTTGPDGTYVFDGLRPGDYVVRVPASAMQPGGELPGLTSSTGNGVQAPDPDDDPSDNDDNGTLAPEGWVQTTPITLDFNTEPTGEPETGPGGDANDNHTVDLGFTETPPMSIGNRVWVDLDESGMLDGAEKGIADVVLELIDVATGDVIATTTTDADGYYLFDDLEPGTYVVQIPASNFVPGGPLSGMSNVEKDAATDPDDDPTDSDDQGTPDGSAVVSAPITLLNTFEPVGEADLGSPGSGNAADIDSNLTVDFGFFPSAPAVASATVLQDISGAFWLDANNNGAIDDGERPIQGVKLTIIDSNGEVVAEVESDAEGLFSVAGLLPGTYRVVVDPSNFEEGGALFGLIDPNDLPAEGFVVVADDEPGSDNAFGKNLDVVIGFALDSVPASATPSGIALALTGGLRQGHHIGMSLFLIGVGFAFVGLGRQRRRRY